MLHTRFRFLRPRSRSQSGQMSNSCHSHNSESTEGNLMKLHRKIKHNKKVCHAQALGSCTQAQGFSRVKVESAEENLMKVYRKIQHNKKVCHAQDLGSYALGQDHNPVRDQVVPKLVSQQ